MREEILHVLGLLEQKFKRFYNPKEFENQFNEDEDVQKVLKISDKIISIFEEEKMTYEDSYAILNFVYESLKYKSQKVNL